MADTALISLPATLTLADARATLQRLAPQLAAADAPVLDASALQVLDSAAVALLLECRRQAAARGRTLRVTGAPPKLAQLAQLYGVAELLAL
ncbi:STAS domain-containing protein [Aquabacterium sp. OR-4]|uniref:STAS domain-containing protein n=1 Tax=Aquabacterium sp. OR-4 TaxID=2978127 RepID=UPI0021B3A860|nr:STAS domain-containing protein [Aquabacterium sp. OR-4]MDT7837557.1 STAS domain-containing protein [Aquabacterium sp. OR-4]